MPEKNLDLDRTDKATARRRRFDGDGDATRARATLRRRTRTRDRDAPRTTRARRTTTDDGRTNDTAKRKDARDDDAAIERGDGDARASDARGARGASRGRRRRTRAGLNVDLRGKKAFVAGVADDNGFGWAISKALSEAGAEVILGTWVPALNIFETSYRRGKFDESRKLSDGSMMTFSKIYPMDAVFDADRRRSGGHRHEQALRG